MNHLPMSHDTYSAVTLSAGLARVLDLAAINEHMDSLDGRRS